MCRLVFKQGLHTSEMCPLLIVLFRSENIAKKQHADVRAYPMDEDTIAMLNAPNNALIGQFLHQHPMGPIIWEQTRYKHNVYYCENNIINNVEVDLDHETVLADKLNNHYQCDIFSSKEKGILQKHKNNMHFFLMLET